MQVGRCWAARPSVLAAQSALGSRPRVALSSAAVRSIIVLQGGSGDSALLIRTLSLSFGSGLFQLVVALGEDLLLAPGEFVCRGHVADRAVQADFIVVRDVLTDQAFRIVK